MDLSSELVSQFAKITNDKNSIKSKESTLYGTVVEYNDRICVQFDGTKELTPVTTVVEKDEEGNITSYKYSAASVKDGDRVSVSLKNHSATITGNLSDPSIGQATLDVTENSITARVGAVEMWITEEGVTFSGLSDGTTVIDGGCIKTGTLDASCIKTDGTKINGSIIETGTISADSINLTGKITFEDLTTELQADFSQSIVDSSNAYETANNALSIAQSNTVPDYIQSTYIDSVTIKSPTIEGNNIKAYGTFQTWGYYRDSSGQIVTDSTGAPITVATGYMGSACGSADGGIITTGVALAYSWDPNTQQVSDKYVLVTNMGVRMQAGSNYIAVTSTGVYINGKLVS